MAACVERRAACGAPYNACASGATPRKFETRQPARPAGKATADRQFQRRVRRLECKKSYSADEGLGGSTINWRNSTVKAFVLYAYGSPTPPILIPLSNAADSKRLR